VIAAAARSSPDLRLPDPALLFEARAARLEALAQGHSAEDWLLLLARIAAGQRAAVREVRVGAPVRAALGPPLAPAHVPRDGVWRRMLEVVLGGIRGSDLPAQTQAAVRALGGAGVARLEALADEVLAGALAPGDLALAPFVGASLQAWYAALAAHLDPAALPSAAEGCPVCGSPAVAGVVQGDDRRRFLSCALCTAEWSAPRLRCTSCGEEARIVYLHLEADPGARAEACSACHAYVKLFDLEKRHGADAAADDAATLALDLVVAEQGYARSGANVYVGR
jgi:FdhE protein